MAEVLIIITAWAKTPSVEYDVRDIYWHMFHDLFRLYYYKISKRNILKTQTSLQQVATVLDNSHV